MIGKHLACCGMTYTNHGEKVEAICYVCKMTIKLWSDNLRDFQDII